MNKLQNWFALLLSLTCGLALALVALVGLWGGPSPARADSAAPQAELHVCASGCMHTSVQSAVDVASPGDIIKIAEGKYTGVFTRGGIKQMVYITQSLTLQGGYTTTNWLTADPVAHPTVLDAESGGRVMVISGTIMVQVEGLQLTGGNANGLDGCLFGMVGYQPGGGGVYIRDATVTISNTVIADNVAAVSKNQQGCGGGLYAQSAKVTLLGNTIRDNHSASGAAGLSHGGGILIMYGTAYLENNQIIGNAAGYTGYAGIGGGAMFVSTTSATLHNNLISGNTSQSYDGGGILTYDANAMLNQNRIVNNSANAGGGVWCRGVCTLTGNLILNNTARYSGGGLCARTSGGLVILDNNVINDNHVTDVNGQGGGLFLMATTATLRHNTIARNSGGDGTAIYLYDSPAQFTNTLIAGSPIGIYKHSGTFNVSLEHTLWSSVITATVNESDGTLSNLNPVYGPSGFASDGYHLTPYSAALEQGIEAGVSDDIDGEARPMPAGTPPDIGADEHAYSPGEEFVAEKAAFTPQWVADLANPAGRLLQRYLLRFYYGSPNPNPPDLTVTVTDSLPTELTYDSDYHNLDMTFQQQGRLLTWQTAAPVSQGQSGEIELDTYYDQPEPGRHLTNTAELRAGSFYFDLQASTQVPVIAPLIAAPGSGEVCTGTITLLGMAQPGVTVTLYANNSPIAQLPTNANGIFTMDYDYPGEEITLKARSCASNGACSADSNPVELIPTKSFWCPQRSTWRGGRGIYRFRDGTGKYSTDNWVVPGYYGFSNTLLELYVCRCPGSDQPPDSVWVTADGFTYYGVDEHPWYRFNIGQAHDVTFFASCANGTRTFSDPGSVLIDPDGFVFDVTQGFDPVSPTLHSLTGVTVTAYVSMPTWGGWVPWPAHLYEDQINPQVTGADGYFAFFTPPGFYYLQVEGKEGYQPWRSPIVQVITEIVHVNVPLTPWSTGNVQVTLTPDGPDPAVVVIAPGSSVEWQTTLDVSLTDLVHWIDNPTLHLLSALDPLSNVLGFDSGMLAPGRVYRRQFNALGTYYYADGAGRNGQVMVTGSLRIFLPLTRK